MYRFDLCCSKDVIFCFIEIWITPNSLLPDVLGFGMFMSPFHVCFANGPGSYLDGSCIFVLDIFQAEHPNICELIEESCSTLNDCCFVLYKHHQVAIISVYHSPSTCPKDAAVELVVVLKQLSQYLKFLMLFGDFNIDLLYDSSLKSEYLHLLSDFNLINMLLNHLLFVLTLLHLLIMLLIVLHCVSFSPPRQLILVII